MLTIVFLTQHTVQSWKILILVILQYEEAICFVIVCSCNFCIWSSYKNYDGSMCKYCIVSIKFNQVYYINVKINTLWKKHNFCSLYFLILNISIFYIHISCTAYLSINMKYLLNRLSCPFLIKLPLKRILNCNTGFIKD